jgi:HupE / UreJ protein
MTASHHRMALLALVLAFCAPLMAVAHETTRSYLTLTRDQATLTADLRIAFRDLEVVVWLDTDLDGQITWGETETRLPAVAAHALASLTFDAGGRCILTQTGAGASVNGGIDYLELHFTGTCPSGTAPLTAASRLFADIDPDHRLFLTAQGDGLSTTSVLGPQQTSITIAPVSGGMLSTFLTYLRAGIEHLAGGADHIVFLLVLMLPAIAATGSPRRAAIGVLMAATGFTIAHALTLTAATLQVLRPRSDVIEALIALSIIVTAIDNIRPFLPAPRAVVAAFFGLIHGFGFATVLGGLTLSSGTLAIALLGFNIGIELAQIGIILVTMPALYMLRGGRVLVWTGSAAAIAIGLYWCVQRAAVWV